MRAPVAIVGSAYADGLPSMGDIINLPLAMAGRYDLDAGQVQVVRSRIYALNQAHARGWKWRTAKLPAGKRNRFSLIVWRVK